MARLGAFCFPGTGHINPMTALARARVCSAPIEWGEAVMNSEIGGASVRIWPETEARSVPRG